MNTMDYDTARETLIWQVRQEKLRGPFMALLRQGLSRRTIEDAIKAYCKEEGRHGLPVQNTTHARTN
jgi:hypothetical protein